jgi:glycosyltransferase involved in cell wall biosynthesis
MEAVGIAEKPWPVMLLAQHLSSGGSERQLTEIALSLDRSEFTPHAGCFRPGGFRERELREAGVPIAHFPMKSFLSTATVSQGAALARYLRRFRIQLVHAFDVPLNVFAIPVARAARVPVVLSSQRASRDLTKGWTRHALRVNDRLVDGVVVNSDSLRRHLIEDEDVPATLIHVCHNGIDLARFHSAPRVHERGTIVVGCVCVLRPEKSLETLVEAFARIEPRGKNLKLRIVGEGAVRGDLEMLGKRLGLNGCFAIEDATDQVAECMREIDIFVLPSRSEGLSNSLMEAMACGCAPVASNVGGNPELVRHEQTGLLFEAGNVEDLATQIRRLADDVSLRERLASAASEFVRGRFSRETAARRMAEIYRSFLAR